MVEAESKIFDIIAVFRSLKTLPLGFLCKSCRDGPKVIHFVFDALKKRLGKIFEGLNQKSALIKFERIHRSVPSQEDLRGNSMVEAKSKI